MHLNGFGCFAAFGLGVQAQAPWGEVTFPSAYDPTAPSVGRPPPPAWPPGQDLQPLARLDSPARADPPARALPPLPPSSPDRPGNLGSRGRPGLGGGDGGWVGWVGGWVGGVAHRTACRLRRRYRSSLSQAGLLCGRPITPSRLDGSYVAHVTLHEHGAQVVLQNVYCNLTLRHWKYRVCCRI